MLYLHCYILLYCFKVERIRTQHSNWGQVTDVYIMAKNALHFLLFIFFFLLIKYLGFEYREIEAKYCRIPTLLSNKVLTVKVNSIYTIIHAKLQSFFFPCSSHCVYWHGNSSASLPLIPKMVFCIFLAITYVFVMVNNLANCVTSPFVLFLTSLMNTSLWTPTVIFQHKNWPVTPPLCAMSCFCAQETYRVGGFLNYFQIWKNFHLTCNYF